MWWLSQENADNYIKFFNIVNDVATPFLPPKDGRPSRLFDVLQECVFMSDRGKGLLRAVSDVFPNVEHVICCKHVEWNILGTKHIEAAFKESGAPLFWEAQAATTEVAFEHVMGTIQASYPAAHAYLRSIRPEVWAKYRMVQLGTKVYESVRPTCVWESSKVRKIGVLVPYIGLHGD